MTFKGRASDVIGDQLKALRQRRKMTAQQLAARCAELRAPEITTSVVANIETGRRDPETGRRRRDVTVDELLILAVALDVPPIALVLPDGDDQVAVTPSIEIPAHWLVLWVGGEWLPPLAMTNYRDPERVRKWLEVAGPLAAYRALDRATRRVRALESLLRTDPEQEAAQRSELEAAFRDLATAVNTLTDAGITPPTLPKPWADYLTAHDLLTYPDAVPIESDEES